MRLFIYFLCATLLTAGELSVEQLFNVKPVTVTKQHVAPSKSYYGQAQMDESRVYDVVLRFGGYVGDIHADTTYAYVKKGEPLFTVYSPEVYRAASELLNTGGDTHTKLHESIVKKLELLGIDRKTIDTIRKRGDIDEYIPFTSPYSGHVIEKKIRKGSSISPGKLLYRLADLSRLWVVARVYEADLGSISEGMEATIRFDGLDKEFTSRVSLIYPEVDAKERSVMVRLLLKNPDLAVFPGQFARITVKQPGRDYLILPKNAVITKGEKHIVFMAGEYEGEYDPKRVEAFRLDSDTFAVTSGLKEGDSVVGNALFLLDSDAQLNGLY